MEAETSCFNEPLPNVYVCVPPAHHRLKWATAFNLRYRLMNPFDVLRDSLYFFKRNLGQIVRLCLPLVIFEALLQQVVDHSTEPDSFPGISVIVGLLVYPLYTAALILFLDARSRGESPRNRDLLAMVRLPVAALRPAHGA